MVGALQKYAFSGFFHLIKKEIGKQAKLINFYFNNYTSLLKYIFFKHLYKH